MHIIIEESCLMMESYLSIINKTESKSANYHLNKFMSAFACFPSSTLENLMTSLLA